jgi:hypothetical protein
MVQVKTVYSTGIEDMESQINEFLQFHKDISVLDIKFQAVPNSNMYADSRVYMSIIIYEEWPIV